MTDEALQAIKERLNAATLGPWKCEGIPYDGSTDPIIFSETVTYSDQFYAKGKGVYIAQTVYDMQSTTIEHNIDADTEFIAHAPADIAALLAEVERLREEVNEYAEHDWYRPDNRSTEPFEKPYP